MIKNAVLNIVKACTALQFLTLIFSNSFLCLLPGLEFFICRGYTITFVLDEHSWMNIVSSLVVCTAVK